MNVQRFALRHRSLALIMMSALPLGACASSQLGAAAQESIAAPRGAVLTVESTFFVGR